MTTPTRRTRWCAAVLAVAVLTAACTGGSASVSESADTGTAPAVAGSEDTGAIDATTGGASSDSTPPAEATGAPARTESAPISGSGHAAEVAALVAMLPANTSAIAAIDVSALSAVGVDPAVLGGGVSDARAGARGAALTSPFQEFARVNRRLDLGALATTVVVGHPQPDARTDIVADSGRPVGPVVVAALRPSADELTELIDRAGDLSVVELPGRALVVGSQQAVAAVVDAVDAIDQTGDGVGTSVALGPFGAAVAIEAETAGRALSFVQEMPALARPELAERRSLESASLASGSFDLIDGVLSGDLAFHLPDGDGFVDAFNALNAPATDGADPVEAPLELGDPIVDGLDRVVVPVGPERDDRFAARFKKLIAGMVAHDYAEGVGAGGNAPWFDFVVRSEASPEPVSPGSVYIRWEFRDEAAIEAFEQNELPAGFRLAPTRLIESDGPEGRIFFALNLYDAGGGSIVGGARAEWDVFVHGPDGADPNAGVRPRFAVVDVAAEEVSADSGNLLTPAEPVSHRLVDGRVVSNVTRLTANGPVDVFASSFPVPDPATAEVARFTREMAIGNDYIYWAHGVSDRVLYNATTFNHDAYHVDVAELDVDHTTRWADYLKPEVLDAVYYVNDLEYVASPMANLATSEHLDIAPEWRQELIDFTQNGHQIGLMRAAVEQLFRGAGDPYVERNITNEVPSTFFHFPITDPDGLSTAVGLPPDWELAPITLFDGGDEAHLLTLAITEHAESIEGTRAEWIVYADRDGAAGDGVNGDVRPPTMVIVELQTTGAGFDPVDIVRLPDDVDHELDGATIRTRVNGGGVSFAAEFDTSTTELVPLALDWIEAGDDVCHLDGTCDRYSYDAETLDVPVNVVRDASSSGASGLVASISTPWDAYIDTRPETIFYRDNPQELAVRPWYNLDVPVAELPFTGLDDPTHGISGSGELIGRTSDVADSTYRYTGDARVEGDRLVVAIDQQIDNALGVGNIFTTAEFDLASGTGTQTVIDCQGPALLCSDIENGSTAFLSVGDVQLAADGTISWRLDVVVDLGGFGIADSTSSLRADPLG